MLWVGDQYKKNYPRLLIIGESRYDEKFTDWDIIEGVLDSSLKGENRRTFTNFVQVAVGFRHYEPGYDSTAFWKRVVYHNYNTTYFPGQARTPLIWHTRMHPQNARSLRKVLQEHQPSHAIVWGKANWDSVRVEGTEMKNMGPILGVENGSYSAVNVDGWTTMFTHIHHPSAGLSYKQWAPTLKAFLAM
jgi:hypothetical protein